MSDREPEKAWERLIRRITGGWGLVLVAIGSWLYISNNSWAHGAALCVGLGAVFVVLALFAPLKWLESLDIP